MRVEAKVRELLSMYDTGAYTEVELHSKLTSLITAKNLAVIVAAVPGELRVAFTERLRAIAASRGSVPFFRGGTIYSYEVEPDPVRRARLKAESERQEKRGEARFYKVVRPAIRRWLARI